MHDYMHIFAFARPVFRILGMVSGKTSLLVKEKLTRTGFSIVTLNALVTAHGSYIHADTNFVQFFLEFWNFDIHMRQFSISL